MRYRFFIALFIGAGLMACSAVNTITVEGDAVPVTQEYENSNAIDSMVAPYKLEMDLQMDSVIATAEHDYIKGRPGGALNNWSADVILDAYVSEMDSAILDPIFCLLNVGGLRNPISKGDVTLGDIYKLMPFDNEVVAVRMPLSSILQIEEYLKKSGGEPIAGTTILNGKLLLDGADHDTKSFWIVTSDYLFNGGDNMDFFEQNIAVNRTGVLMRDVMINGARSQGVLKWDDTNRISF